MTGEAWRGHTARRQARKELEWLTSYEERMSTILAMGLGCGWLEQATQHKPCDGCGKPKADYSFYRITAAGQAALDAAKALRAEKAR